jgi:hypothetical protein
MVNKGSSNSANCCFPLLSPVARAFGRLGGAVNRKASSSISRKYFRIMHSNGQVSTSNDEDIPVSFEELDFEDNYSYFDDEEPIIHYQRTNNDSCTLRRLLPSLSSSEDSATDSTDSESSKNS